MHNSLSLYQFTYIKSLKTFVWMRACRMETKILILNLRTDGGCTMVSHHVQLQPQKSLKTSLGRRFELICSANLIVN